MRPVPASPPQISTEKALSGVRCRSPWRVARGLSIPRQDSCRALYTGLTAPIRVASHGVHRARTRAVRRSRIDPRRAGDRLSPGAQNNLKNRVLLRHCKACSCDGRAVAGHVDDRPAFGSALVCCRRELLDALHDDGCSPREARDASERLSRVWRARDAARACCARTSGSDRKMLCGEGYLPPNVRRPAGRRTITSTD